MTRKERVEQSRRVRRTLFRIVAWSLLGLLALLGIVFVVILAVAPGSWQAYTDHKGSAGIKYREGESPRRNVFWAPPRLSPGAIHDGEQEASDPAVTSDGRTMIYSRSNAGGRADLYTSSWDGAEWSEPRPLALVNTPFAETSPAISRDGRYLFFQSDRRGGFGGFDLYVAFRLEDRWTKPVNLGADVNSEFDEVDPALTYDDAKIYFASNRPTVAVSPEQRRTAWQAAMKSPESSDLDIYAVDNPYRSDRENPMEDVGFREKIITSLGGSPETEKAVMAALDWFTRNQETDGHWSTKTLGGSCRNEPITALALLCYMGWGARHNEPGPYQGPLNKGLKWLLANQPPNGDWTFGVAHGNGMYAHGIVTTALAEAYSLTKDPAVGAALDKAVAVTLKAQSLKHGGWRYSSTASDGDSSVVGWQIMSLKSAEMAGVTIDPKHFQLAGKWYNRVGGGKHKGLYGYTGPSPSPRMVAEGMFAQQLMGLPPSSDRQKESAQFLANRIQPKTGRDFYLWYYGTLAAYQHQGDLWAKWNPAMKTALLSGQTTAGAHAGSWPVAGAPYGRNGGMVYTTALATLTLEVYYRLLPMYNIQGPAEAVAKTTEDRVNVRVTDTPPTETPPLVARRIVALCSPQRDRSPAFTEMGDWVYFASDRTGGEGGYDVYRARMVYDEIHPPQNIGFPVNTPGNETSPTLWAYGFAMALGTDNEIEGLDGQKIVQTVARDLDGVKDFQLLDYLWTLLRSIFWWLIIALVALAALAYLLYMLLGPKRDELGLLAKCIIGSIILHALLLAALGIWKISREIQLQMAAGMEVPIDAGTLDQEKLAMEIRETVADLESLDSSMNMSRQTVAVPKDSAMNTNPLLPADAFKKVGKSSLQVTVPKSELPKTKQPAQASVNARDLMKMTVRLPDTKMETRKAQPAQGEAKIRINAAGAAAAARHVSVPTDTPIGSGPGEAKADLKISQALGKAKAVPASALGTGPERLAAASSSAPDATRLGGLPDFSGEVTLEAPRSSGNTGSTEAVIAVGSAGTAKGPTMRPARGRPSPLIGTSQIASASMASAKSLVTGPIGGRARNASIPADRIAPAVQGGNTGTDGMPAGAGGDPKLESAPGPTGGQGSPEAMITIDSSLPAGGGRTGPRSSPGAADSRMSAPQFGPAGGGSPDTVGKPGAILSGGLGKDGNIPQIAALRGPGEGIIQAIPDFKLGADPKLEQKGKTVSPHLLRDRTLRAGLLKGLGGSEKTERAVALALNWFTANQEADGRWSARKHGGACRDEPATAFAVLCYFGYGFKHTDPPDDNRHRKALVKAVEWMLKHQPKNGDWTFGTGHGNGMYAHGVCAIALAEAYGLTQDPSLLEPARKALTVILKAQNPTHGGWRYTSRASDGDTSVVGWQVMALKSARMAGIEVPEKSFDLTKVWLNRVGGGKHKGLYGYASASPSPAMVAEGMFCQQLMGLPPELPRMQESAKYLQKHLPRPNHGNFYTLYYGSLAAYQHQGDLWAKWNPAMQKALLSTQVKAGPQAGSWVPNGAYRSQGGRVLSTAMATLSLEVFYRYLPLVDPDARKQKDPPK